MKTSKRVSRKETIGKPSAPDEKPAERELVPQPHGGALLPGAGGGPQPGSGRPPNSFKDFLRKMRENPKMQEHLQETLEGRGNKAAYAAALKLIADYDPDMPANLTPEERKARVLELAREGQRRKREAEAAAGGTAE